MDAKDLGRSPDYITLSYNTFTNRYWTVAYGTQNSETSRCRTSLMYNTWDACARRCPQIGNGTAHVYNNYYTARTSGNLSGTSQIIAGEGSAVYSENCRFEGVTGYEVSVDSKAAYSDAGSYTSTSSSSTPYLLTSKLGSHTSTSWRPSASTYGYELVNAYNTSNYDTKTFCKRYAGCFSSYDSIKYVTDSTVSAFISKKYTAPFLRNVTVGSSSGSTSGSTSTPQTSDSLVEGAVYMIQNVNSGQYLNVDYGKAANNTNIQQWGSAGGQTYESFRAVSAGDGYYYLYSQVGDKVSYLLSVNYAGDSNVNLYTDLKSDAQKFRFVKNSDGTYYIVLKANSTYLSVANASLTSGANVDCEAYSGSTAQKWNLKQITDPGAAVPTSGTFQIKNASNNLYFNVAGGKAADHTNLQVWGSSNPAYYDTFHFVSAGNGYYYIYSYVGDGNTYMLDVLNGVSTSGTNIDISSNDGTSAMLFKFVKNADGTYNILTKASKDKCGIQADGTGSGSNVSQATITNSAAQHWYVNQVG